MSDDLKPAAPGDGELQVNGEEGACWTGLRKIDADSPEFLETVSKCLPADVSDTVMEFHASFRSRYRRYEILLILLALCGIGWFVYLYFPRPIPAPSLKFAWHYRGPRFPGDSPFLDPYTRACEAYNDEHYEKSIAILQAPLSSMEEKILPRHDALFYLYFASCERAGSTRGGMGPISWARRLVGQDRDNLMWHYFLVLSPRRAFPSCGKFYEEVRAGKWRDNWERKLQDVNQALEDLQILEEKSDNRRRLPQRDEIKKQLTLLKAELLTFKWILKGGRGTADFPDDNLGDPGVDAREEAWRLIDEQQERPFVELKVFILKTLLEQDSWYNQIYWNSAAHGTRTPLTERMKQEEATLTGGGR